jgi:acid stress-induced BolA-like protein IbaG/YrbA
VKAAEFAGQSRVAQQRTVYAAIGHLMKGETAPVHAIDKMEILIP